MEGPEWLGELTGCVDWALPQSPLLASAVHSNDFPQLNKLCFLLEQLFFHGLRDSSLFGKTYYWDFCQHLSECLPDTSTTIQFIKECARTSLGRGRVFICLGLNEKVLSEYLKALAWNETLVSSFYHEWAVLRTESIFDKATELCDKLREIAFNLDVKDRGLDMPNYWNAWRIDLHQPKPAVTPVRKSTNPTFPSTQSVTSTPINVRAIKREDQQQAEQLRPTDNIDTISLLKERVQQLELQNKHATSKYDNLVLNLQQATSRIRELEDELQLYKRHITFHTSTSPSQLATSPPSTISELPLDGTAEHEIDTGSVIMEQVPDEHEDDDGSTNQDDRANDHVVFALHERGKLFLHELKTADQSLLRTLETL